MFPRGKKYLCVQLWTSPYQQYTKWICCQKILVNTMNMLSDNYLIRKCVSHLLNSHLGPPYLSVQLQLNQPRVSIHVPPCKHGFVAQWSFAIREMSLHCSGDLMKQFNHTKKNLNKEKMIYMDAVKISLYTYQQFPFWKWRRHISHARQLPG